MFDFTPISNQEYEERILNLQKRMNELDLDVVIVAATACTYENIRYFTGYWPMFERGGICIPRKGQSYLLIGAEAPGLAKETPLGSNYFIMHDFSHTFPIEWKGVKYSTFNEVFEKVSNGAGIRRVGLADAAITSYETYDNIKNAMLPGGEIVDITTEMIRIRNHKTDHEIDLIRTANKINERVFDDFLGQVKPEMTEYQCQGLILAGIYKYGGEGESFPTLLYAGERTLNQIGRGSHTPIGRNRLVDCDFGAMVGSYSSAYSRPFMFGKMPDQMKKEINFVVDMHKRVINDWVKPGIRMSDIQKKFVDSYLEAGFGYPSGASHGLGIFECEPPLMSQSDMIIEKNMTFAADHFYKGDGYGFRFEDCYVVTDDGTELFTDGFWYPIEL